VEAGDDVPVLAVVEDAETPLAQLTYQWTASAGTIAGSGASAVWRMPRGMTAGVNVTLTLTVTETYHALGILSSVTRQQTVSATSAAFRVHDSEAETKELARKFLVDLFGNSAVPAEACMTDFATACAALPEGRAAEFLQIVRHRREVIVFKATVLAQRFDRRSFNSGSVHSAMLYDDRVIGLPPKPPTCGDFELTMIYEDGRWWICESYFHDNDRSHCPATTSNDAVARVLRRKGE
jgi:hypothetical protein